MAAILNGFLPFRKKDQYAQERILNTRWGDAAISAPIHGGWNSQPPSTADSSPDLERELPSTPPQLHEERDGVYIVRDEDDHHDSEDDPMMEREHASITIPLPWRKKPKAPTHSRKPSIPPTTDVKYNAGQRIDLMPPPLATAEAAAIPLPESRVTSPVGRDLVNSSLGRTAAISPVLSFRSRLASPNLGDMLSPVMEGFAKSGPSSRPAPVLSPLTYVQTVPLDRPPTASSVRSSGSRRSSITSYGVSGMGLGTMSSQATTDEQMPDFQRPASRGLGATAHMRASSRGPRAGSKGPRAASVEPYLRRAASVEPTTSYTETTRIAEPVIPAVLDLQPVRRRAPSVEPVRRRSPSVEPDSRRAPSVGPANRRAVSREPRGRRGLSVEPVPNRRHHSEAPRKLARDSFSSNDGSIDSESEKETLEVEPWDGRRGFLSTRRPRRRRSIASPMSSPTASSFGISSPPAPTLDSIAARAGLIRPTLPGPPTVQRNPPRNRSKSRTRGLYADMQDDFRLLGRDVQLNLAPARMGSPVTVVTSPATTTMPSPLLVQPQATSANTNTNTKTNTNITSPSTQHAPSPALSSHPPTTTLSPGLATAVTMRLEPERTGYSSDSSLTGLPSVSYTPSDTERPNIGRLADTHGGRALLAAMARERKDQLRREERERAREKVIRRMERERERIAAMNALSDCESIVSGRTSISAAEKTRRVYGSSGLGVGGYESDASLRSWKTDDKELVRNPEEIWG